MAVIKQTPQGTMNLDDDAHYLNKGDYGKAMGIRWVSDSEGDTSAVEDVIGNEKLVALSIIDAQNKIYRIYFSSTSAFTYSFQIYKTDNTPLGAPITFIATSGDIATTLNAATSVFNLALVAAGQTSNITQTITNTNAGYLDIELTTITGYEYTILNEVGGTAATITIRQEAYDTAMAGQVEMIGSKKVGDFTFVWGTTQDEVATTLNLDIINVINNGSGEYRIITNAFHNLQDGQSITITRSTLSEINGTWIIRFVGLDTFDLRGSTFVSGMVSAGGLINIWVDSIGELGVITKDENDGTGVYFPLARTKRWGFRKKKQIDAFVKFENDRWMFYWVDDYNSNRCMYYDGPFFVQGAFTVIYYKGLYSFETIFDETILTPTRANTNIELSRVIESGGGVLSGNNRYAIRLITEGGTATDWSDLCNPINLYKRPISNIRGIRGDDEGVDTGKQVELLITGLVPGLFKFIDLANVNYLDQSMTGLIVKRLVITGDTMLVTHTGTEADTEVLALETLNTHGAVYSTAKNIDGLDNRLVLSNLTTSIISDFSSFAQSFRHRLKKKQLTGIDKSVSHEGDNLSVNEYLDPKITNQYIGYMINETYRFGAKITLKNGTVIPTIFYIDDIKFDALPNNTGNVNGDNRRISGLNNYDIVDSVATNIYYVPYVEFEYDPDWIINGVPVKNLISKITIERVDLTESQKEVLAAGYFIPAIEGDWSWEVDAGTAPDHGDGSCGDPRERTIAVNSLPFSPPVGQSVYWEFNVFGRPTETTTGPSNYEAFTDPSGWSNGFGDVEFITPRKNFGAFYSPDIFLGKKVINYINGDALLTYGDAKKVFKESVGSYGTNGGVAFRSEYAEFRPNDVWTDFINNPIEDVKEVIRDSTRNFGNIIFSKAWMMHWFDANCASPPYNYDEAWSTYTSPALKGVGDFQTPAGVFNEGLIYSQYFRDHGRGAKFSSIGRNKYVTTNSFATVDVTVSGPQTISVFGGDTFTQRTYFKQRYAYRFETAQWLAAGGCNTGSSVNHFCYNGYGGGMSIYSQNRINSQMPFSSSLSNLYPEIGAVAWLETAATDQLKYNHGYDVRNELVVDAEFDTTIRNTNELRTRIAWSQPCPNASLTDFLRVFMPFDFKDLELSDGEIIHHRQGNGELLFWQPRNFRREYFNSNALLTTSNDTQIIVGDGSVMRQKGVKLSSYGCNHKWAIVKGISETGKDVFYWPNTSNGRMIRFGMDGTANLTTIKKMRTFFRKGLKWAHAYTTPASDWGIHGVWDERNSEVLITVRAQRVVEDWFNLYSGGGWVDVGTFCYTVPNTFSSFIKTKDIYECILYHSPTPFVNKPGSGSNWQTYWKKLSHDDLRVYNEYTVVFSEIKNGWTTFMPFIPKIYAEFKDTYLSPRPITSLNDIYEHNEGELLTWYKRGASEQAIDGYIEMPINYDPNNDKDFVSILFNTKVKPYKVDFRTTSGISYLLESDFEYRKEQFFSTIKNDSTITIANPSGLNDQDTSRLYGTFLMVKLWYQNRIHQKVVNFLVKINSRSRNYNT